MEEGRDRYFDDARIRAVMNHAGLNRLCNDKLFDMLLSYIPLANTTQTKFEIIKFLYENFDGRRQSVIEAVMKLKFIEIHKWIEEHM